jgi:multiple sugar transport system substrate-binding protein/raffinose/stachyose/melibiose transport system substrate-binding protein
VRTSLKAIALSTAAALSLVGLAACGGNATDSDGSTGATGSDAGAGDAPVTMIFWHNGTGDKSLAYWDTTITAFQALHPNVTIQAQAVQNEDFDGKLQAAMQAGTTPDVFLQRGGGKMADMVAGGQVMDITDKIAAAAKTAYGEGVFAAYTSDGKVYGMPAAVTAEGIFYSQDLFDEAGVTENPTDMAGLDDAVAKLKAAGIAPIALGAKDAWPAAHWFYQFALRECSQEVVDEFIAGSTDLTDACWKRAVQDVADLNATEPFNQGFLTTSAQTGAGSSAGLLANHKAAMELMGAWEPGVLGGLTEDQEIPADLRLFPFPAVPGAEGDPSAMMAGLDGYSCKEGAPEACVDLLNFLAEKTQQEGYATAYGSLPASKDATSAVTEPSLKSLLESFQKAKYVVLWFDTSLGQDAGNGLNQAIVSLLAGQLDVDAALSAIQTAVKSK